MPNELENQAGVTPEGSQPDSQQAGTQDGVSPAGDTPTQVLTPEQIQSLQDENTRLKGQVSSVQKKYQDMVRKGMSPNPTNPSAAQPNGNVDMQVIEAATQMAGAQVVTKLVQEIFPLYDGSNPDFANDPSLPQGELSRILRNPWAFCSQEAYWHALNSGDIQPAMLEIEQAISDRAAELASSNSKPNRIPKSVNPSPAPQGAPAANGQPQLTKNDLWTMPMDQLDQLAQTARSQ